MKKFFFIFFVLSFFGCKEEIKKEKKVDDIVIIDLKNDSIISDEIMEKKINYIIKKLEEAEGHLDTTSWASLYSPPQTK